MSTPLTKSTYLAAKTLSVAGSILLITFGPALLYLLGKTIKGLGPNGIGAWFETFGRLLLACSLSRFSMCLRLGIFMLYKPQSDRKYRRVPCLCGHQHSQLDPL